MAIGVYDVTKGPKQTIAGGRALKIARLTFDTDYAAGGYAVTPAMFGMSAIDIMICNTVSGFVPEYVPSTGKVKVLFGDNNNAADGPLIEVADGADAIDTLAARVLVIGTPA